MGCGLILNHSGGMMTTNTVSSTLRVRLSSDTLARIGPLLTVSTVFLLLFAIWVTDLGYHTLSGDESFIAQLTSQPASAILARLNYDEPHPPVYYLLMRGWNLLVGGRPEFLVRFPSLLIGMLMLSLTYRIGRDLGFSWPVALLMVVWLGLNPHYTAHVREARMYGPMITTLALAVLIALRFDRLSPRAAIPITALVTLLALMTHYFNILFIAALTLWGLLAFKGLLRRKWIIAQGMAWLFIALWLPLFGTGFFNPTSLEEGKIWSFTLPPWETIARVVKVAVLGYRDFYAVENETWIAIVGGVLLVAGFVLGGVYAQGRRRWLLLIGAIVPLLTYALLGWVKPLFHAKYMLPLLLFVALALGSLLMYRRRFGVVLLLIVSAIMIPPTIRTWERPYDPAITISRSTWLRPFPRDLNGYLIEHAGPTDVFAQGSPDAANCYYANFYYERHLGCELLPQWPEQTLPELKQQLDALLSEHAVLWFMDYYNPSWDPNAIAQQAFTQDALSLGNEEISGGRLLLYTDPDRVMREYYPIGARIGEVAELEGAWVAQGKDVHVVLMWRSLVEQPQHGAKVFVHLLDGDGQQVAQNDGIPVWWTRPLETWHLDERLLDVYSLVLPQEVSISNWTIRVGLYNPDNAQRFVALDATGRQLSDDAVLITQTDLVQHLSSARR